MSASIRVGADPPGRMRTGVRRAPDQREHLGWAQKHVRISPGGYWSAWGSLNRRRFAGKAPGGRCSVGKNPDGRRSMSESTQKLCRGGGEDFFGASGTFFLRRKGHRPAACFEVEQETPSPTRKQSSEGLIVSVMLLQVHFDPGIRPRGGAVRGRGGNRGNSPGGLHVGLGGPLLEHWRRDRFCRRRKLS